MYYHVVLGGTFDHLHVGHRDLLNLAFSSAKKVTLGLTKASMNRGKDHADQIESYGVRKRKISQYVESIGRTQDLNLIPIKDLYGSTLNDQTLEAIIVTVHTKSGADTINAGRVHAGHQALPIVECPLHLDVHGEIISSSRIRNGEINCDGFAYADLFTAPITLSEKAKKSLRHPIGKSCHLHSLRRIQSPIVVVGDVSTHFCCDHSVPFNSAFIDGKSRHADYEFPIHNKYTLQHIDIENPAGMISASAATLVRDTGVKSTRMIFQIQGEEDLLTLAAVLQLPFGTQVVYGYPYEPHQMRCITVNERTKNRFAAILG